MLPYATQTKIHRVSLDVDQARGLNRSTRHSLHDARHIIEYGLMDTPWVMKAPSGGTNLSD